MGGIKMKEKFEADRRKVVTNMELSEDAEIAFQGRWLANASYNTALYWRRNNEELWAKYLLDEEIK